MILDPGNHKQPNIILAHMLQEGLVKMTGPDSYAITEKGRKLAKAHAAQAEGRQ